MNPHKLRHLFATYHNQNGTNLFTLQQLLGHRTLAVTQRYVDTTTKDLISATNELDILNKLKYGI